MAQGDGCPNRRRSGTSPRARPPAGVASHFGGAAAAAAAAVASGRSPSQTSDDGTSARCEAPEMTAARGRCGAMLPRLLEAVSRGGPGLPPLQADACRSTGPGAGAPRRAGPPPPRAPRDPWSSRGRCPRCRWPRRAIRAARAPPPHRRRTTVAQRPLGPPAPPGEGQAMVSWGPPAVRGAQRFYAAAHTTFETKALTRDLTRDVFA
ncbi:unnamed protein product [Prorocentrum cordatum]|uniref:Uncharacterized protein n=1 Tax=Prorocentrum cordatum TaxID=2364126 RepID=A0ABN9ULE1_9DINO|nr:unnamed protein product [Polarella glacialis]